MVTRLSGIDIELFTYLPLQPIRLILVVLHGSNRNAAAYRNYARHLAEELGGLVIAPAFPKTLFPWANYQMGGVSVRTRHQDHMPQAIDVVAAAVAWCHDCWGIGGVPIVLLGHSAGGQLLSRCCAYLSLPVQCIVIANPSTWVLPSRSTPRPYGFGRPFRPHRGFPALLNYIRAPVIVLLGSSDTGRRQLASSADARAQGANRLHRGLRTYAAMRTAASRYRSPFGWSLLKVAGVGHSAARMFACAQVADALRSIVDGVRKNDNTRG